MKRKRRPRSWKLYRGWLYQMVRGSSTGRLRLYEPWRGRFRFYCMTDVRDMVRLVNRELRVRPMRQGEW